MKIELNFKLLKENKNSLEAGDHIIIPGNNYEGYRPSLVFPKATQKNLDQFFFLYVRYIIYYTKSNNNRDELIKATRCYPILGLDDETPYYRIFFEKKKESSTLSEFLLSYN